MTSKPARQVSEALKQAEQRVKEIAAAMNETGASDRLVGSLAKIGASAEDVRAVSRAFVDYTKSVGLAGDASQWTREAAAGVRAWETSTINSVKAVIRERRAESDAMRNIAREQNQILQRQADEQKNIRKEAVSGVGGFAGGMVGMGLGFAGIAGAKDVLKASANLAEQQAKLQSLAKSDQSEVPFANQLAGDIAKKFPNISTADALEMYNEIRAQSAGAGGVIDRDKATRNLGIAASTKTGMLNLGQDFTAVDAQNLQRAVEGSGRALDPTAFNKLTDAFVRAKQVYGSAITSEAVQTFVANAKASNFSLGDNAFYREMFARLAEGNAARFGNETSQTLQTLVGGHALKQTAQWLVDHHLATGFEKMGGGAARIEGLKGSDLLQTDQGAWANQFLFPALKDALSADRVKAREDMLRADARKADPNAVIDEKSLTERAINALAAAEVMKMGVRGTVADNLTHWIANMELIKRDSAQMDRVAGRDENAAAVGRNPAAALSEMTGAMSTFASVVGGPLMAPAAGILDALAHSLGGLGESLAAWQKSNPTAALATSAAAIAALAGGGGAAVLGAGGSVAKAIGLGGVGGAMSGGASALGKLGMIGAEFSAVLGIIEMATNYKPPTDELNALNKWSLPGLLSGVNPFGSSHEITRPAHPGRDVHSPSTGPYSYTPAVHVDTSEVDGAKTKIDALGQSHPTVAVNVDLGAFEAALARIRSGLQSLGVLSGAPGLSPSLGSTMRGNFTSSSIHGE
jgi:hypothetical protein